MDRGAARRAAFAATLLLAACAPLPPSPEPQSPTVVDGAFTVVGRLSAKRGSDGVTANFEWAHTPLADAIALATPLGQTLAKLEGTPAGASIVLADGSTASASSFDALTDRTLGAPLPVSGLVWWIRGAPRPGIASSVERDSRGRAGVLRQEGWEIVFAYADDAATLPRRLVLTYPDVEVRVVVDAWP